jgi:ribose 5-phosphate isomerase A
MTQDEAKRLVARRAVEFVENGMVVGLGTGTTATLFIRELAARKLDIRCVASSDASHDLAKSLGMRVETLVELPELDLYIDGADEVARANWGGPGARLDLIKGGGGALLREKIVASAAREFICVVDSTKVVERLGKFPLPVEVIKMALPLVEPRLAALGLNPKLRRAKGSLHGQMPARAASAGSAKAGAVAYPEAKAVVYSEAEAKVLGAEARALAFPEAKGVAYPEATAMAVAAKGEERPYRTDEGNYILDCACGRIEDPEVLAAEIRSIVGVVEHGLFLGMATLALVAGDNGVTELRP